MNRGSHLADAQAPRAGLSESWRYFHDVPEEVRKRPNPLTAPGQWSLHPATGPHPFEVVLLMALADTSVTADSSFSGRRVTSGTGRAVPRRRSGHG
jgi:hypothetical protein